MHWIYLSPHLDDVALSCGGLVWEQAQAGATVAIWTVCAGGPPRGSLSPFAEALHVRWQTGPGAVAQRRVEDRAACQVMGATFRHFRIPDCIYRRCRGQFLYASEEGLFGPLHPSERARVQGLSRRLKALIPAGAQVVCPLALGGHVDHRLTRAAAEQIGRPLWYYADYPYALRATVEMEQLRQDEWAEKRFPISTQGAAAWVEAAAAHGSQISTFWPGSTEMRAAIWAYAGQPASVILWKPRLTNLSKDFAQKPRNGA
jgi:LmbE family N-acetylglucosaminyl deacetylase